jgi:hypothetical protein
MGAREGAIASSEQRREGLGQRRAGERQVMSVPPEPGTSALLHREAATTKALGQLWPAAEPTHQNGYLGGILLSVALDIVAVVVLYGVYARGRLEDAV